MDLQLKGKSALISGSTKGIGLATAKLLAAEGAKVILNGRTEAAVAEARKQIPGAEGFAADLARRLSPNPPGDVLRRSTPTSTSW